MRKFTTLAFIACSIVSSLAFAGCGNSKPESDLPPTRPITEEEAKAKAKEVMDGMKGQYKGAPKS